MATGVLWLDVSCVDGGGPPPDPMPTRVWLPDDEFDAMVTGPAIPYRRMLAHLVDENVDYLP